MAYENDYGCSGIIEDRVELFAVLKQLIAFNEAHFPEPWTVPAADDYAQKLLAGIVGFEIEITRLEGKFKLSQNRPEHDRQHVTEQLSQSESATDRDTPALMAR